MHYEISVSVFQEFFTSTDKIFISGGGLSPGQYSMKFWEFADISWFPEILILTHWVTCEATLLYYVYYWQSRSGLSRTRAQANRISKFLGSASFDFLTAWLIEWMFTKAVVNVSEVSHKYYYRRGCDSLLWVIFALFLVWLSSL